MSVTSNEGRNTNNDDKPGCLGRILQALGLEPEAVEPEALSYHVRDDFLSHAERSFYHVLRTAVSDWAVICPKVSLGDLFFAKSGAHRTNVILTNQIAHKHVDFLLCDPRTLQPLLGVELDDSSHRRASRQERDTFVDKVFAAAGLPLFRQTAQAEYDVRALASTLRSLAGKDQPPKAQGSPTPTAGESSRAWPAEVKLAGQPAAVPPAPAVTKGPPLCPKCGQPMVVRVVQQEGPRKGTRFWGCPSYPRCRGIREMSPKKRG